MFWLIKQILHVRSIFKSGDTPKQLALGVGLGVMLGLVMGGNLLALALTALACATRANLSMVAITTLCVGLIAPFGDPVTHEIGYCVLTLPFMQTTFERMYALPVVPWTNFNHTIVMGSFVLGVASVYPAYRTALPLFRRWKRGSKSPTIATAGSGGNRLVDTPNDTHLQNEQSPQDISDKHDVTAPETTQSGPVSSPQSSTVPTMSSNDGTTCTADEQQACVEQTFMDAVRAKVAAEDAKDSQLPTIGVAPPHLDGHQSEGIVPGDAEQVAEATSPPSTAEAPTTNVPTSGNEAPDTSAINVTAFREVPKSNYGRNASVDL